MQVFTETINPKFIEEIETIVTSYDDYLNKENKYVNYVNLYQKNLKDLTKYTYLLDYIKEIQCLQKDLERCNILYYGFIVSQPNSNNQHFHLDYRGKTLTYFIPMTDITDLNGTEYLYMYNPEDDWKYYEEYKKMTHKFKTREAVSEYLLKNHNLILGEHYEFRIANAPAHSVIYLPQNVFHRGKSNESGKKRIMFQVTMEVTEVDFIQDDVYITNAEEDEKYDDDEKL